MPYFHQYPNENGITETGYLLKYQPLNWQCQLVYPGETEILSCIILLLRPSWGKRSPYRTTGLVNLPWFSWIPRFMMWPGQDLVDGGMSVYNLKASVRRLALFRRKLCYLPGRSLKISAMVREMLGSGGSSIKQQMWAQARDFIESREERFETH